MDRSVVTMEHTFPMARMDSVLATTTLIHTACSGYTHVRSHTNSSPLSSLLTYLLPRWRHAHVKQPHQMACQRRRRRISARLVPRPLFGAHIHQPRRRNSTSELLATYADGLWHNGTKQPCIPQRQCLHAAGAPSSQLHSSNWQQRYYSDRRGSTAWRGAL